MIIGHQVSLNVLKNAHDPAKFTCPGSLTTKSTPHRRASDCSDILNLFLQ